MKLAALVLFLIPFAAQAQLALFTVSGTIETLVGASYNLGEVPGGAARAVQFRARPSGSAAVPITKLAVSGSSFSIASPLTPPPNIAAGSYLDIYVNFSGGPPAYYTATFQINSISVLLQVTALPGPSLQVLTGCTGPDPSSGAIAFGAVPTGQLGPCGMFLVNMNPQSIVVTVATVSGSGFQIAQALQTPLTIAAGKTVQFSINFQPTAVTTYSGMLTVNTSSLSQSFPLTGSGQAPQLTLFTVSGTTETPAGATYNMGQIAAGSSITARVRARNPGNAAIPITSLAISGFEFSITSPLTPPPNVPPGSFLDIYIQFSGGPPASYSANFQVDGIAILLQVTAVAASTVSVLSGCTGPDPSTGIIGFGTVQTLQVQACVISLQNLSSQSLSVATVAVSGTGFQIVPSVQTPLTLAPGKASSFTIDFSPTASAVYSGLLTVDTQTFPLTGAGLTPALPTPILAFDSGVPTSAQQVNLTMSLPAPSPTAASGSVNLAFQPDSPLITDDPAVSFLATGARSVPFSINPGDTQILLGGLAGAVFQTGTSSGRITFTVSINVAMSGDPTVTMTIPPALIFVESASAIARSGALDVQVWGFDNTYSAGNMAFTFYDVTGKTIGAGAITADFTSAFRTYFTSVQSGSAFQMLVSFPVTGDASQVGAIDLQMTNTAGTIATQHLPTINEIPYCVKVSASKVVCTAPPNQ
jgi:hypothetical protein